MNRSSITSHLPVQCSFCWIWGSIAIPLATLTLPSLSPWVAAVLLVGSLLGPSATVVVSLILRLLLLLLLVVLVPLLATLVASVLLEPRCRSLVRRILVVVIKTYVAKWEKPFEVTFLLILQLLINNTTCVGFCLQCVDHTLPASDVIYGWLCLNVKFI